MKDRKEWLIEIRKNAIKRYDIIFSRDYDDKWGDIEEVHEKMIRLFLSKLCSNDHVLDAACGTGKYWSILKSYNLKVTGMDQSIEMLKKAKQKNNDYETRRCGLQELNENSEYDGIMCIDAMENVFPEDWNEVLHHFNRALKDNGILYFTVEIISKEEKDEAYQLGKELNVPLVYGEFVHEGGYHYYPEIDVVKKFLKGNSFYIIEERISEGYHHFIVQKRP